MKCVGVIEIAGDKRTVMNKEVIRRIFTDYKNIAAVGMSTKPDRPSQQVPLYLREHGYHILPVNPTAREIAGIKAYPDLLSIPERVDVVDIFVHSEDVPPIVEQAIQIGAQVVWMQEGIVNEPAAARAREAGLTVVQDMCMRATHRLLFGQ